MKGLSRSQCSFLDPDWDSEVSELELMVLLDMLVCVFWSVSTDCHPGAFRCQRWQRKRLSASPCLRALALAVLRKLLLPKQQRALSVLECMGGYGSGSFQTLGSATTVNKSCVFNKTAGLQDRWGRAEWVRSSAPPVCMFKCLWEGLRNPNCSWWLFHPCVSRSVFD